MKKTVTKILIYSGAFILLFALGIAISDIIIITKAKYILKIADKLNFEKDMQKIYPTLYDEKNGFSLIKKVYDLRQNLPPELKKTDLSIVELDLRDLDSHSEKLRKFRNTPEISNLLSELDSVPYTTKFSLNYAAEPKMLDNKLNIIKSLHKFYIYQLRFCSIEKEKLQSLHIFQKMLILHRALERQNINAAEKLRCELWLNALDCLVHYGPTEKRYEEYYKALQMLVNSLDFEFCSPITVEYNNLKKSLIFSNTKADTIFAKHNIYITNLKTATNNFRKTLMQYPLPTDFNRNPQLPKDVFVKNKTISQTHLKTLMLLKLYQLKHGNFPEAIEGFNNLPYRDMLIYKRISPNDFVLSRKPLL